MRIGAAAFACSSLLAASCLDLSDAPYTPRVLPDAAVFDAGTADGDASLDTPCDRCIFDEGAPCRSAFDDCAKNPACDKLVRCAAARGCFAIKDVTLIVVCGQPCLDQAGITSSTDPAPQAAAGLYYCVESPTGCQPVCVP